MSKSRIDRGLFWATAGMSSVAGAIIVLIVVFLAKEAMPALKDIGIVRFFTDTSWHPSLESADGGGYNLAPMLIGSILAMIGALLVATPLSLFSAIFCHYYAPPIVARVYRRLIELLAGIPSVVYGFWGLVTLVPIIQVLRPPGPSLLAGILILAIMILPTITLMAHASLANVPRNHLLGAASLGLSRWATLRAAVIPLSKSGITTAIILGSGRAIGETMAILMVCGNVVQFPKTLFDPIRTLTSNIALEMAYAVGNHRSALFANGLVLIAIVSLLVVMARIIAKWSTGGLE